MPQTKLQEIIFAIMTVSLTVFAFEIYNISLLRGSLSNEIFYMALKEFPLVFLIAFILIASFVAKIAQKKAFTIVNPEKDRPIFIILAITCCTICLMCPLMSGIMTALFDGLNENFLANWIQKTALNFPFAFFIEIFLIGPVVRFIFHLIFYTKEKKMKIKLEQIKEGIWD